MQPALLLVAIDYLFQFMMEYLMCVYIFVQSTLRTHVNCTEFQIHKSSANDSY